jgi:hypothetical protein
MAENNLDKALAYLGTSLNQLVTASQAPVDLKSLHNYIPKRSLSGDHINGGKIVNFASSGIADKATVEQLTISDDGVSAKVLSAERVKGNIAFDDTLNANIIKVNILEVKELRTNASVEKTSPVSFKAAADDSLYGKGLLWSGQGHTKQFIFAAGPDKFFSSEPIELAKNADYRIDGKRVLSDGELGTSVTKSYLREVGRLKGLIVDGSVNINQYLIYNGGTDRLGLGIEEPHAGFAVAENGVEVMLGTAENNNGLVGTYAATAFDIVTDNTSRIGVGANGHILLGNRTCQPIEVGVHGKLGIGVKTIDPRVDLHVAGSIKFAEHIHQYAASMPDNGTYNRGDIVWNSEPEYNKPVGWVCVCAGSPGTWAPFGEIRNVG